MVITVAFRNEVVAFCNKPLSHFVIKELSHFVIILVTICNKLSYLPNMKPSTQLTHKNRSFPVDTRRRFNVYKTSIRRRRRRIDVLQTLKQRRVSTGIQLF